MPFLEIPSAPVPLWSLICRHVMYGSGGLHDPWAVFELPVHSYPQQPASRRVEIGRSIADFCVNAKRDFQLLRVATMFDPNAYETSMRDHDGGNPHESLRTQYIDEQGEALRAEPIGGLARVFLSVSLKESGGTIGERVIQPFLHAEDIRGWARRTRDQAGFARKDWLSFREFERHYREAQDLLETHSPTIEGFKPVDPSSLEWLIRRCWSRHTLTVNDADGSRVPQPLVFERNGQAVLEPQHAELIHLTGMIDRPRRDWLHVESDDGSQAQGGMVAVGLPGSAKRLDRQLEIFLRPQDHLEFPIDLCINGRYKSNQQTVGELEDLITNRTEEFAEEAGSNRGPTGEITQATVVANEARDYATASGEPSFDVCLSMMVSGKDKQQVRARQKAVKQTFRSFGVPVVVPPGQQLQVFMQHCPAQPAWIKGFHVRAFGDQIGSMVPTAEQRVGTRHGYLLGTTLSRYPRAIRWDSCEPPRQNKPPGVLIVGNTGSGKTFFVEKENYQGYLENHRLIDLTAKGDDHKWIHLPEVQDNLREIVLQPDPALRGMIDPWLNAPKELRADSALDFLLSLCPDQRSGNWETALTRAVTLVAERCSHPCNSEVLLALREIGTATAIEVADHLSSLATNGIAQLGFATPQTHIDGFFDRQVTFLLTENLPMSPPGIQRREKDRTERIGDAIIRLIALLPLGMRQRFPDQVIDAAFDEARALLTNEVGIRTIDQMLRMGRSRTMIPWVSTQYATDVGIDRDSIGNMFGTRFTFKASDEQQAECSIRLHGIEPTNELVGWMQKLESGQALMSDHTGQVGFVQILATNRLTQHFLTTPKIRQKSREVQHA